MDDFLLTSLEDCCDDCGEVSSELIEIHGYAGSVYLICPDCWDDEDDDG